jgi:acyl-coenzyme A thioesterase PaaI-like protein
MMNVTEIPFNKFLNIAKAEGAEPALLELNPTACHLNHIGTVHAGALLTLAEAGSGEWLMRTFPEFKDRTIAVVRRVEAKFKSPMNGKITARAKTTAAEMRQAAEPLSTKGRAIIPVTIEVVDAENTVGLVATFDWFAQMNPGA